MANGVVKWFSKEKGFGFIRDNEIADDIFVHFSEIAAEGFRMLFEGDFVEYEVVRDEKGAKARNVRKRAAETSGSG